MSEGETDRKATKKRENKGGIYRTYRRVKQIERNHCIGRRESDLQPRSSQRDNGCLRQVNCGVVVLYPVAGEGNGHGQ